MHTRAPITTHSAAARHAAAASERVASIAPAESLANRLQTSPRMSAQRRGIGAQFGPSALVAQCYVRDQPAPGDKLSEGRALVLRGEQELYAGEDQFAQANSIGSQLTFNQGAAHPSLSTLHRVEPAHKERTPVADDSASFERDGRAKQVEKLEWSARDDYAEKSSRDALHASVMEKLEDDWDSIPAEERVHQFGDEEFDESRVEPVVSKCLDLMLAIFPIPAFDQSRIATNFRGYLQKQIDNGKSILMPSDCGQAAAVVLGRDIKGVRDGNQAGNVHTYTPSPEKRDTWEWDHHFATVVMHDGNDHVTLENAGGKASDGAGKLTFDRTWFFEMYGTERDQTFKEKYAKDFGD